MRFPYNLGAELFNLPAPPVGVGELYGAFSPKERREFQRGQRDAGLQRGLLWSRYTCIAKGPARHFVVTGGLQEGYGAAGKLHTLGEVIAAHHAWQQLTKNIMGLTVAENGISYGWPQDGSINCATESGWRIEGGVSILYDATLSDTDVWNRLESLAGFIADRLGQTRVYLSLHTSTGVEDRILQAQDESTPTGS